MRRTSPCRRSPTRACGTCSASSGPYPRHVPLAALGDDISNFFGAVGDFFGRLAEIRLGALAVGLAFFGLYLTIRSRAYFHVLRAAYPDERIAWRRVWGAYIAAYGFNNVIPARGGDVIKLFLVKNSIAGSSYSAVGASFFVELIYDAVMGIFILAFAFSQGVFPKPPDFAKLNAFDLSFFAGHPRFTLFVLTVLGVNAVAAAVPFTPGGAGVQQAFLVKVFAGTAASSTVAAYSVGQQIAIGAFTLGLGFVALVTIFRFRSFKDVIAAGRADREEGRADAGRARLTEAPAAPRARA